MIHITCNMCSRDLLICMPSGFGHTYQANPSCPCYNYYIYKTSALLLIIIKHSKVSSVNLSQSTYICRLKDFTVYSTKSPQLNPHTHTHTQPTHAHTRVCTHTSAACRSAVVKFKSLWRKL